MIMGVNLEPMDNRLSAIKEYLTTLKKGFLWMKTHPDEVVGNQAMIERAKTALFPKGKQLGVSQEFSVALLVFGPSIDWKIINQFN